jgi:hypothetical protein
LLTFIIWLVLNLATSAVWRSLSNMVFPPIRVGMQGNYSGSFLAAALSGTDILN